MIVVHQILNISAQDRCFDSSKTFVYTRHTHLSRKLHETNYWQCLFVCCCFFFATRTATKQSFKSTIREKYTASLSYQSQCEYLLRNIIINSRTYAQIHTPTVVQGGWGGWWNPRVADVLQYFEKILPSMESLRSFQQDEVFCVGGSATGGLWRH